MTVDLEGKVVRGIDLGNTAFLNCWGGLPGEIQDEAIGVIRDLLGLNLDLAPKKLHLHTLKNRNAPSVLDSNKKVAVWSIHITADDKYKASFTFEDGTMFFRTCGRHDTVDKKP